MLLLLVLLLFLLRRRWRWRWLLLQLLLLLLQLLRMLLLFSLPSWCCASPSLSPTFLDRCCWDACLSSINPLATVLRYCRAILRWAPSDISKIRGNTLSLLQLCCPRLPLFRNRTVKWLK